MEGMYHEGNDRGLIETLSLPGLEPGTSRQIPKEAAKWAADEYFQLNKNDFLRKKFKINNMKSNGWLSCVIMITGPRRKKKTRYANSSRKWVQTARQFGICTVRTTTAP